CTLRVNMKNFCCLLSKTSLTVAAAVGEQACLNCLLIQTKEVLQVTWQKILPDRESNVITYDKYLKKLVNADFQGKVELIDAGLQNSSILIRNVTEEDEGCYRCMFNTYPDGALTATTCLKLYGQYLESNSPEEVIVFCSATGRPAPTVTLNVLHHKLNFSTHSFKNTNGTVTVNTTCLLMRSYDNSTQVECEVQVLGSSPYTQLLFKGFQEAKLKVCHLFSCRDKMLLLLILTGLLFEGKGHLNKGMTSSAVIIT
uniref:Ig-like domain-containing protein n=1 Tax=Labrus bergylta TaxID=56723 RepID=A0A3Q3G9N5_9LABR